MEEDERDLPAVTGRKVLTGGKNWRADVFGMGSWEQRGASGSGCIKLSKPDLSARMENSAWKSY